MSDSKQSSGTCPVLGESLHPCTLQARIRATKRAAAPLIAQRSSTTVRYAVSKTSASQQPWSQRSVRGTMRHARLVPGFALALRRDRLPV